MNTPDPQLTANTEQRSYNQCLLVYLLLLLHPLYGITALIGVIICHTKPLPEPVYSSHRTWQIWTFWTGLIGYAAGFYYIVRMGTYTILLVTLLWILYRIGKGWMQLRRKQPVGPGRLQ